VDSSSAVPSCLEQEPFNPDRCLRELPQLTVVKRDGTQIPITSRGVRILPGANITTTVDPEDDTIILAAEAGAGIEDPYFRQKAEAIASISIENPVVSGPFPDPDTGVTPEGPAWSFSIASTWIGGINNVPAEPDTGSFFIVGDNCTSVGQFNAQDDPGFPEPELLQEGSSSAIVAGAYLSVLDVCAPCLDCLEYNRLQGYLNRIEEFYNYIFALTRSEDTDNPPVHPDGGVRETFVGVHPQLMSALRYWDYLVHVNSVKVSAQSMGQAVTANGYYKNISEDPVGAPNPTGVTSTLVFRFYKDGVLWDGMSESFVDVRILDRSEKPSATEDVAPTFSPASGAAHTITVSFKTTNPLASGEETFADVALLFKNTNLFNDPASEYTVTVTYTVDQTHLDPVSQTRDTIVYFQPPEPEESA
jgi:hypothetical protein